MNATITWTANTEPDLADYRVHHGLSPGSYFEAFVVTAPTTTYNVVDYTDGIVHYFAITARDTSANESGFSQEVFKPSPQAVRYGTGPSRVAWLVLALMSLGESLCSH